MTYEQIIEKAIEFATKAHAGQKRKDGKDYITHPIAVLEIARKESEHVSDETKLIISLLSLFHDIAEDVHYYKNKEELVAAEFIQYIDLNQFDVSRLVNNLKLLNKNRHENYLEYILAIRDQSISAAYVKRADLAHNMSDLKEGSLKDKYRLAYYLLERSTYQG